MAKRNRTTNQKKIAQREKEGRGQKRGGDYRPYLNIQDVPSCGLATRDKGWKTGRVHHLMSKVEWQYFYTLEWSPIVCDIREQYPLELEETLAIAELHGILHPSPTNRGAQDPSVMTTDVVVTVRNGLRFEDCARTIKYVKDLSDERVMAKFEIERLYWESKGVDWGIVTEREIDTTLIENVSWLHKYYYLEAIPPLTENIVRRVEAVLTPWLLEKDEPLDALADACDDRLALATGISLMAVRHLLANRRWETGMSKLIIPSERLVLTAMPEILSRRRIGGTR